MMTNGFNKQYAELTRSMMKEAMGSGSNTVCSPLSLYLLMLAAINGTAGNSRREIIDALVPGATDDEINELIGKLPGFVEERQLLSSNGVCIADSLIERLDEEFLNESKDKFRTEVFKAGDDAVERINAWVNRKTRGMIDRLVNQLPRDFKMCLLNALAFDAKWSEKYEEDDIYEDTFYGFDKEGEAFYMHSEENRYVESERFTGFIKDYEGSRYALMALLPKKKGRLYLKNSVDSLDICELYRTSSEKTVYVTMPEFECESSLNLNETAMNLGIKEIFTEKADFSSMLKDEPLMVSAIIQKATVKVNRAGTKAAAATAMIAVAGCLPDFDDTKYVDLDRPFVYAIIDKENDGLPIFVGTFEG